WSGSKSADKTKYGILYLKSKVRMAEITDGLSNTLLVGERPTSNDLYFGWWFAGAGYPPDYQGVGDVVLGAREVDYWNKMKSQFPNNPACNTPSPKVGLQPGNLFDDCDQTHFWSLHAGGANFLLADGSVRFVSYNFDNILPDLTTRAGNEVINGF